MFKNTRYDDDTEWPYGVIPEDAIKDTDVRRRLQPTLEVHLDPCPQATDRCTNARRWEGADPHPHRTSGLNRRGPRRAVQN
jgi:hypothetical protein